MGGIIELASSLGYFYCTERVRLVGDRLRLMTRLLPLVLAATGEATVVLACPDGPSPRVGFLVRRRTAWVDSNNDGRCSSRKNNGGGDSSDGDGDDDKVFFLGEPSLPPIVGEGEKYDAIPRFFFILSVVLRLPGDDDPGEL